MTHVNIFLMIIGLPILLATAFLIYREYRKYRFSYLLAFTIHFSIIALGDFLSILNNYIFANVLRRFGSGASLAVETAYRVIGVLIHIVMLYLLIFILAQFLERPLSRLVKRLYYGLSILLFSGALVHAGWSVMIENGLPVLFYNIVNLLSLTTFASFLLLTFFARTWRIAGQNRKTALQLFFYINGLPIIIISFLAYIHVFGNLPNNTLLWVSAVLNFIYCATVFFFRQWFMEMLHGKEELEKIARLNSSSPTANHNGVNPGFNPLQEAELFEKYKISKREQEIVRLICSGKTNKQIEDELFISLQTVKDHIYRIYKKTGVKNRVQLTNLFRG